MNKIDLRLNKFAIVLKDTLREAKTKETKTSDNAVLNLWPSYTLKEVFQNNLFYEQPITQPPLMTSQEFQDSLRNKNVSQEMIDNLVLVTIE